MTDQIMNIAIEIVGKSYTLKCSSSEADILQQAGKRIDKHMRGIKDSGKIVNLDKIAIVTALEMAYQLIALEQEKSTSMQSISQRIETLQDKLELALGSKMGQKELEYA